MVILELKNGKLIEMPDVKTISRIPISSKFPDFIIVKRHIEESSESSTEVLINSREVLQIMQIKERE
jgi:hypothetical protein